jgi:cobyrinic acid a,c-diamide synthase
MVAGLSGGAGKTILSLGLARALVQDGLAVLPFKKGPDYIDAQWLGLAAGRPACNLDAFFLPPGALRALFFSKAQGAGLALAEGNRGLFDGLDVDGSCSSAELARLLDLPVLLTIDCTKMTRTVAALVAGVTAFDPALRLAGVVLGRVAGQRHEALLRQAIERYTDAPVLGALPKISPDPIPERHMGLISNREYADQEATLDNLAHVVRQHTDLPRILAAAAAAPDAPPDLPTLWPGPAAPERATIGFVRDAALWFYYPENLEALSYHGARLVELSLLSDQPWPDIHGLYLGGGFPETQAAALHAHRKTGLDHLAALSRAGLPIYAECGGFMVLCRSLQADSGSYPMADVLPLETTLCAKPQGLGYVEAEVLAENPFHPLGARIKGHEFHYSRCAANPAPDLPFTLALTRGHGMHQGRDGLLVRNTFAAYTHLHALACPWWAPRFVEAAERFRKGE